MANKKGLFAILNDGAGAGVGIDLANPDTTLGSAIDNTIASPAFINSSGVLVFPQLNDDGALVVSTEGAGTCQQNYAKVVGSTSFQDLGKVGGLAVGEIFKSFEWSTSSMTEACYQLVYTDDLGGVPVETVLAEWFTGPGQYSYCCHMDCLRQDTSAGTGVQEFKIQAKLLDASGSEISGNLAFIQAAV